MKKTPRLVVLAVSFAVIAVLSGCGVSPQRQFAFSPDGERIAYINYPNNGFGMNPSGFGGNRAEALPESLLGNDLPPTGIAVKDLKTGVAKSVYQPKPHFVVHAVFWSETRNVLYFLESNFFIAEKKRHKWFIFNFKELDLDTGGTIALKSGKKEIGNYSPSNFNVTRIFVNFDETTGILTVGSRMWTVWEKRSALDTIISELYKRFNDTTGESVGDFTVSPDRKRMSFVSFGRTEYEDNKNEVLAEIHVVDLRTLKEKAIYSADCSRQFHCMFMMGGVRWSPDGKYLYYVKNFREIFRLMRYDTATGESKKIAEEQIIGFDVFPGDGKLLILHERAGTVYLSTAWADGKMIETNEAIYPGVVDVTGMEVTPGKQFAFAHLKAAPDGKHAAAAGITNLPETSPIIIYDLEEKTAGILAETENENIVAGLFHNRHKRYEEAEKRFKAGGAHGALFLYTVLKKLDRNDEAAGIREKALSAMGGSKEGEAQYRLARFIDGFGADYDGVARGEYLEVEGRFKGKALYYLSALSTGNEKIEWLERTVAEFRAQGCLEDPTILCEADLEVINYLPIQLGYLYLVNNRPADAVRIFESARKFPFTQFWYGAEAVYYLGASYEKAGNCPAAITAYSEFLDSFFNDAKAKDWFFALVKDIKTKPSGIPQLLWGPAKFDLSNYDLEDHIIHAATSLRALKRKCGRRR